MFKKGKSGENLAIKYLKKYDFTILETNFYTKYGEIDIIARKNNTVHFIEVKTTYTEYDPAQNFHKTKLKRLLKSISVYCYRKDVNRETIQVDLILIDIQTNQYTYIPNANIYFN